MRGGSAPSWRQGQGLCPAEKAETAARCGFTVPVLEGARLFVDREMHALSSLIVTSARAQPACTRLFAVPGCGPGAPVDPGGSILRSGANKSDRTRPRTTSVKTLLKHLHLG